VSPEKDDLNFTQESFFRCNYFKFSLNLLPENSTKESGEHKAPYASGKPIGC